MPTIFINWPYYFHCNEQPWNCIIFSKAFLPACSDFTYRYFHLHRSRGVGAYLLFYTFIYFIITSHKPAGKIIFSQNTGKFYCCHTCLVFHWRYSIFSFLTNGSVFQWYPFYQGTSCPTCVWFTKLGGAKTSYQHRTTKSFYRYCQRKCKAFQRPIHWANIPKCVRDGVSYCAGSHLFLPPSLLQAFNQKIFVCGV